jgi:hypothetical protein
MSLLKFFDIRSCRLKNDFSITEHVFLQSLRELGTGNRPGPWSKGASLLLVAQGWPNAVDISSNWQLWRLASGWNVRK